MIIADAGSTGILWASLEGDREWNTEGFNPNFHEAERLSISVKALYEDPEFRSRAEQLVYYGTGCFHLEGANIVQSILEKTFGGSQITVHSDLLGAARATMGEGPGWIGILGTGSSLARYENGELSLIPTRDFPEGNEASGFDLMCRICKGWKEDRWSPVSRQKLEQTLGAETLELVLKDLNSAENIRKIAGILPKGWSCLTTEERESLVFEALDDFRQKREAHLAEAPTLAWHLVGSVAYHLREWIYLWASARDIRIEKILQNPIDGLKQYHLKRN